MSTIIPLDDSLIGKRIKTLRLSHKLSQEKLSENLGYTSHYIYQIESGARKPSLQSLNAISKYFNVSLDYLVNGSYTDKQDNLSKLLSTFTPEQRDKLYIAIKSIVGD